jgi:Fur family ferric uptake transcriptional regulator
VEIEADAVEQWAKAAAASHGVTDALLVVDVFGLCASCSSTSAA